MVILSFIVQLILFFLCWRLFMWLFRWGKAQLVSSLWAELLINAALGVLLLIVLDVVHSTWWLAILVGCFVGAFCAQVLGRNSDTSTSKRL